MVVDKQVELETKLLKEYVEWNFLSEKDLSRNTIEIFYDLKTAKRSTKRDQRVIKMRQLLWSARSALLVLLQRGNLTLIATSVQ